MTIVLRVDHKEECGADKQYYECSQFDFKYDGCCSHDPCIKPRGCRDDPVISDPSSWPTTDMSDTETTATEGRAIKISTIPVFSTDVIATQTTLMTRRRPSDPFTMPDDEESSLPDRHTAPPPTMTDSGTTRTVANSHRVTVTNRRTVYTSISPSTPTGFATSGTLIGTDQLPFPTGSLESTAASLPTETSPSSASLENNNSNTGSPSIGLVVGAVVGGVAFLALIIAVVVYIRRRRAKNIEFPNTPYYLEEKGEKSYLGRMLSRKSTRRSQDPFAPFGGMLPGSSSDSSSDVVDSLPRRILKLFCRPYRQSRQPAPAPQWHF